MQGYVQIFRPSSGSGTIRTTHGLTFGFRLPATNPAIDAGDVVTFEAPEINQSNQQAREVRVIAKWPNQPGFSDKAILADLYAGLQIEPGFN